MGKLAVIDNLLRSIYYDLENPASYGGVSKLYEAGKKVKANLKISDVKIWLKGETAYTLHKPIKRKFKRRKTRVYGIDFQWQADLADLQSIKGRNNGNRYLLCVIDVFSKRAWVRAIKDKTAKTLIRAFDQILNAWGGQPRALQTDKGGEFVNAGFRKHLSKKGIHFFTTENPETKASIVERFQRTLKTKMWKYFTHKDTRVYIDVLQNLVTSYNRTVHSSTGFKPIDVNKGNEYIISEKINGPPKSLPQKSSAIRVGDTVRINKTKLHFEKGYLPNWTTELFTVYKLNKGSKTTFGVKDLNGEIIKGSFYGEELQTVTDKGDRRVEKILKRRVIIKDGVKVREKFVKWRGYGREFNTWIAVRKGRW